MLTYHMEARGGAHLYEFLYRSIRTDILNGTLTAGEKLPSKRALAEHLQVSVITVESAYQQLEAEGYVSSCPKRGFFVNPVERTVPPAPPPPLSLETSPPVWKLDLSRNQTDLSRFPAATWARLTRQVLAEDDFLSPAPHQGLPALRQAITDHLRTFRGMSVLPEQVVVGAGAEYLYLLLAQLFGAGAVFALEDPGYPKIRQVYQKCGAACRPVPMDHHGMDLSALRASGATVAHLSPNHHYPTGIITPIGRRQALLRWAGDTGGFLIEDDYDSEFRFVGRQIPTLQSIDPDGRVVYMNTFSQTIAPSIRVGFMVLPFRLLERYRAELDFYACTVPVLDQYILARFLSGGYYEQHLSRMRKEYRARRAAVLDAFQASPFAHRITLTEQGSGLHFLLRLKTRLSDAQLRRHAEALGVRLGFLSDYAATPDPHFSHTLVVNYGSLEPSRLPETVALLTEVFLEPTPSSRGPNPELP